MRAWIMVTVGALVATTVGLGASGPPAGAAVTVTSSGTEVTAHVTGASTSIGIGCVGGGIRVGGVAATPSVACTSVTDLTIVGDDTSQVFDLAGANTGFPALPAVVLNAAGGADLVLGSSKRDVVLAGAGNDQVILDAVGADDALVMGGDASDSAQIDGGAAAEAFDLAIGTPTSNIDVTGPGGWAAIVGSAAFISVVGQGGADSIDGRGVTTASSVVGLSFVGGDGDDVLLGGDVTNTLQGDTGTNTLEGGPGQDVITTSSPTDTIRGQGGDDSIVDDGDGRIGDRTIVAPGSPDDHWTVRAQGDAALRVRRTGPSVVSVTGSLARTGRQDLGSGVGEITFQPDGTGLPGDRVVVEVAALSDHPVRITSTSPQTIVDVVAPTGSWSVTSGVVTFTGGYQQVIAGSATTSFVRAPYTDPAVRFAHRVVRDLEMRIPSAAERTAYANQLTAGTRTRTQIAASLTSTDTYRGIAVDRAFVDILRRGTDIAGRAYWVERLRDGLVLRRLRANLYGSPEYFSEQGGGTNRGFVAAAYRDILGRTAGETEIDYWVGEIAAGRPRGTVADRFLNTSEARTVVIRDQFLRFADREPTTTEISTWSTALSSSTTDGEVALIRMLAASGAYYNRPDA